MNLILKNIFIKGTVKIQTNFFLKVISFSTLFIKQNLQIKELRQEEVLQIYMPYTLLLRIILIITLI